MKTEEGIRKETYKDIIEHLEYVVEELKANKNIENCTMECEYKPLGNGFSVFTEKNINLKMIVFKRHI